MAVSWQQLAVLMEMLFIAAMIFAFRETIISRMYGVRYKRWQEIDTGRMGYTILSKGLNSCKINGMIKSVNRANIKNGVMYFVSDVAENLKAEDARDKYQFYMNSEEFDTVYKNNLLRQLMLSLQSNMITILMVLVFIAIVIEIYNAYTLSQMMPKLDYVVWRVNQSGY